MKAFCILLFFTSTITLVFGQRNISKVIIDDETGLPIANAHIYIDRQFKKGTKTNLDGRFILKGVYKNEVVERPMEVGGPNSGIGRRTRQAPRNY